MATTNDATVRTEEPAVEPEQASQNHTSDSPNGARAAEFASLENGSDAGPKERKIDLLLDITLPVTIELGRTSMLIKDIIDVRKGSIIELDKAAGEPVDILVNGKKMAEGEVVIIEQRFAVRIVNLVTSPDRINSVKE